jgi:PIN domain nuclease of toxin-antitoxin system
VGQYIADTHALVWHLTSVLVEMVYLSEKLKISRSLLDVVLGLPSGPRMSYAVVPLDVEVVRQVADIPREALPDPQDRIIAATARVWNLPIITRDRAIAGAAGVQTVW